MATKNNKKQKQDKTPREVFDVLGAARFAGVERPRIYDAIENGSLRCRRLPSRAEGFRITLAELKAWMTPDLTADVLTIDACAAVADTNPKSIGKAIAAGELVAADTPDGKRVNRTDLVAWLSGDPPTPTPEASHAD